MKALGQVLLLFAALTPGGLGLLAGMDMILCPEPGYLIGGILIFGGILMALIGGFSWFELGLIIERKRNERQYEKARIVAGSHR